MGFKSLIKHALSPIKRNNEDCEQNDADMKQSKVDTPKNDEENRGTNNQDYRKLLSPCEISNKDKAYRSVKELKFAIDSVNCTNIAVAGGYGSGKSSVIKTYLKENSSKKILNISLSSFDDYQEGLKPKTLENLLEYKLYQHILFKTDPDKTAQGKHPRKLFIPNEKAICISLKILGLIVSIGILFEPEFLVVDSLYNLYFNIFGHECGRYVNTFFDLLSLGYILFFIGLCLYHIIKRWKGNFIKSIKAKDVKFQFKENRSVFSDCLEEILYFFKAGGYEVVVFEDIDRVSNTQDLFLKLREINILLNESEYYKKKKLKIKFVYAIKDDLFNSEIRTKFFDYVVPVIPIVDKYNAGEYLIKQYDETLLKGVDKKDISELGLYIQDMRQLANIINEFGLYEQVVIQEGMTKTKLLSIIIYKNIFPHDFSLLQQKKGCLYNIFNHKEEFYANVIASDLKKIEEMDRKISEKKEEIVKRRSSVTDFLGNKYGIQQLIIDGTSYDLNDFAQNDDLYYKLEHNQIDRYIFKRDDEFGKSHYDLIFRDIIKELNPEYTYYEIMGEDLNELESLISDQRKIKQKVSLIKQAGHKEIIEWIGNGQESLRIVTSICTDAQCDDKKDGKDQYIANLLHSFVRNGYITDDYSSYISYYYPGTLKENTHKFLHSVLQGIALEYDFEVPNPGLVVKALHTENFRRKECLNFGLVSYILESDDSLKSIVIQTTRENLGFAIAYYQTGKFHKDFVPLLFNGWKHCIREINKNALEDRLCLFEMLFVACPQNNDFGEDETKSLNDSYYFIIKRLEKFNNKNLKDFFLRNKLKFKQIYNPRNKDEKELYEFVKHKSLFEINLLNLQVIYGDKFNTCSYQCIKEGNESVETYLGNHLNDVMDIMPDTDTEESVDAIIELSNKIETIGREQFEKFLSRQNTILESFTDEVGIMAVPCFFGCDKIKPTWANIEYLMTSVKEKPEFVPFVIRHADELSKDKIEKDVNNEIRNELFTDNNTLPLDVYKKLHCCITEPLKANDLELLNDERLELVVKSGCIEYEKEMTDFVEGHGSVILASYLIRFFDDWIDEDPFDTEISNRVGIAILDSNLAIEQKKKYLDNVAEVVEDKEKEKFCQEICSCYLSAGIDNGVDLELIIKALKYWQSNDSWTTKIRLINQINKTFGFETTREKEMLDSLGGNYVQLSTYRGVTHFPINSENEELLFFLKEKSPFVSDVKTKDKLFKVTYKIG